MWWHTVTHGRGKWSGNWRMEWVASSLHTTSEHGVSSITTAYTHTSAASGRLNWRPRIFKWTHSFRRKTISGFRSCAITFQLASTGFRQLNSVTHQSKLVSIILTRTFVHYSIYTYKDYINIILLFDIKAAYVYGYTRMINSRKHFQSALASL
jgi:hypothetical protein